MNRNAHTRGSCVAHLEGVGGVGVGSTGDGGQGAPFTLHLPWMGVDSHGIQWSLLELDNTETVHDVATKLKKK